jgi:hypothetical protein
MYHIPHNIYLGPTGRGRQPVYGTGQARARDWATGEPRSRAVIVASQVLFLDYDRAHPGLAEASGRQAAHRGCRACGRAAREAEAASAHAGCVMSGWHRRGRSTRLRRFVSAGALTRPHGAHSGSANRNGSCRCARHCGQSFCAGRSGGRKAIYHPIAHADLSPDLNIRSGESIAAWIAFDDVALRKRVSKRAPSSVG